MSGFGSGFVDIDGVFELLKKAVEDKKRGFEIRTAESVVMLALESQSPECKLNILNKLIVLAIKDTQDKLDWKGYVRKMVEVYREDGRLVSQVQSLFAQIDGAIGRAWGDNIRGKFNEYLGAALPVVVSPIQVQSPTASDTSLVWCSLELRASPVVSMDARQRERVGFALSPIRGMGGVRSSSSPSPSPSSGLM